MARAKIKASKKRKYLPDQVVEEEVRDFARKHPPNLSETNREWLRLVQDALYEFSPRCKRRRESRGAEFETFDGYKHKWKITSSANRVLLIAIENFMRDIFKPSRLHGERTFNLHHFTRGLQEERSRVIREHRAQRNEFKEVELALKNLLPVPFLVSNCVIPALQPLIYRKNLAILKLCNNA